MIIARGAVLAGTQREPYRVLRPHSVRILGNGLGETLGYLLTAAWTALVIIALALRVAGRWFSVLGLASAGLVGVGVLSPLDLPVVHTANFFGYILWSVWLTALRRSNIRPTPTLNARRPIHVERRRSSSSATGLAVRPDGARQVRRSSKGTFLDGCVTL